MKHQLEARLARIEARVAPRRKVMVWEDGTGTAKREIARLRAAGEGDDVEFVVVSWEGVAVPT